MFPILIFDLDDTLYAERTFVESGFKAVADWLEQRYGWDAKLSLASMNAILQKTGRGSVFNQWLMFNDVTDRKTVQQCVRIYRHHIPTISLYPEAQNVLSNLLRKPYLVTDGHKIVQYNKIKALKLEEQCTKVLLTHRYGIQHEKPSTLCFQRILEKERRQWTDIIYVGDNPTKDFVGLNPLLAKTVRVRTGEYAKMQAKPGFEAQYIIDNLNQLPDILPDLGWR